MILNCVIGHPFLGMPSRFVYFVMAILTNIFRIVHEGKMNNAVISDDSDDAAPADAVSPRTCRPLLLFAVVTALCLLPLTSVRASAERIRLLKGGTQSAPVISVQNDYFCPVEVNIRLTEGAADTVASPALPASFVVGPKQLRPVVRLQPANPSVMRWSYRYAYNFTIGDPKAFHRPEGPYLPPFQAGQRFRVVRGPGDGSRDGDPINAFSAVILMPPGTPVSAARSGVVVYSQPESGGGSSVHKLYLLHADGTFGLYAHLKGAAPTLPEGTAVQSGQVIGQCGRFAGVADPALHFAVLKNGGMRLVSVPFQFQGRNGAGVNAARGMVLER